MTESRKTDPSGRLNSPSAVGEHGDDVMDTVNEQRSEPEVTESDEIADLGVDVQMMYQRVRLGLGLPSSEQPCIGRYRVEAKLGEGGMGAVYRAYDPKLERDVAIKIVTGRPLVNADKLRARLLREAQLLAKLRHPNVVTVHDTGEHAGEVFLAMEYVEGQSLREWQETPGRLRDDLLMRYLEAGRGLAAAHDAGIIHRDFKPDNVFVSAEGYALVGDFGLANLFSESTSTTGDSSGSGATRARMTQTGELLGTIGYMAPEQLRGDEIDARTDQYAFCVSLWEAVAGAKPFDGPTREALLEAMIGGQPGGGSQLPAWLRRTLQIGLSPAPAGRHPSMSELLTELERGLGRAARWRLGAAFGLAGLVTLASLVTALANRSAERANCDLVDRINQIEQNEGWKSLRGELPLWDRVTFERRFGDLERAAYDACQSPHDRDRDRHRQFIDRWVAGVERAVEESAGLSSRERAELVAELDREYLAGPLPIPLTEAVNAKLVELASYYDQSRFEQIIESTQDIERTEATLDRAELYLHRGRASSFTGDYQAALRDLSEAAKLADENYHDDARLRAYLLIAKLAAMRTEDLDGARIHLSYAKGLFERLDEPALSRRRADYLEIASAVDLRLAAFDEAASKQQLVVLRHAVAGTLFERSTALTNLGIIEEYRGDLQAAERCYRAALAVVPDDPEPMLNLGRLLVNRGEERPLTSTELDDARSLLAAVLASEHLDLHVLACTARLQLDLQVGELAAILRSREDLVERLSSDRTATPTHRVQAWAFVVIAHAAFGDLGPEYESALAELVRALDAEGNDEPQVYLADVEAHAASKVVATRPEIARELANRALVRLESIPDSEAKRSRMDEIRALLDPTSSQ